MSELKPCPFCGAKPEIVTYDVEPQGDPWYGGRHETFVLCDCGACLFDGAFHEGFWDAETRAVAAWNCRAASAAPAEGRDDRAEFEAWWETPGPNTVSIYDAALSAWQAAPAEGREQLCDRIVCEQNGSCVGDDVARGRKCKALATAPTMSEAVRDVLAERRRQVEVEGWTPEHDDANEDGRMAQAAACYALPKIIRDWLSSRESTFWPWHSSWWKPSTPRRDLVKAGALILAEIERIDRAAAKGGSDEQ